MITDIEIIRESIDARRKPEVKAVYTLDFDCESRLDLPGGGRTEYRPPKPPGPVAEEDCRHRRRPVIAGFGPCGIFAALILAESGIPPIVIERGKPVDKRIKDVERFWKEGILDPESNVQFGEGGAGTFSDGKLTTGIRDIRIRKVLEEFVKAGAEADILYRAKPHIGTDRLRQIIPGIRRKIERAGGEIHFETKLTGLEEEKGRLRAVVVEKGSERRRIPADDLILAIGHSARDTFRMLREAKVPMRQKPFSIGVRIEHPQETVDRAQYGDPGLAEIFGPAEYKLHHRCENGRGVYTFCMCPGGKVIDASTEEGGAVTNGMSESRRDSGIANSGLLVDVRPSDFGDDDPLAGVEFQRRYERKAFEQAMLQAAGRGESRGENREGIRSAGLPRSSYGHFRKDPGDPVRESIPAFASEAILEAMPHLGAKLQGFDGDEAVMTAVETRSSSPVRILRDEGMQSGIEGVIPAGEGPGYAGGIMSAAVDGIRAAEAVILRQR